MGSKMSAQMRAEMGSQMSSQMGSQMGSQSGPEMDPEAVRNWIPKLPGIGYQTGQGLVPHFLVSGTWAVWRLNKSEFRTIPESGCGSMAEQND
mgnify:CR=1 FL=1